MDISYFCIVNNKGKSKKAKGKRQKEQDKREKTNI